MRRGNRVAVEYIKKLENLLYFIAVAQAGVIRFICVIEQVKMNVVGFHLGVRIRVYITVRFRTLSLSFALHSRPSILGDFELVLRYFRSAQPCVLLSASVTRTQYW